MTFVKSVFRPDFHFQPMSAGRPPVVSPFAHRTGHLVIVHQATNTQFLAHALGEDIEDVISRKFCSATGHCAGPSEVRAWKHSLLKLALKNPEISNDAGVAVEYQLPQTVDPIDSVITGEDDQARSNVDIVKLKQWSESRRSEKHGFLGLDPELEIGAVANNGAPAPIQTPCSAARAASR